MVEETDEQKSNNIYQIELSEQVNTAEKKYITHKLVEDFEMSLVMAKKLLEHFHVSPKWKIEYNK